MAVSTTAHLNSRGHAREMLEFYRGVTGGEVSIATYSDIGAVDDPAQADQVAFGALTAPSGFRIMAYDVQPAKPYDPGANPFYVVLRGDGSDEIQALWDGLADGAREILAPIGPAPFQPLYGMLTDRFGVTWILGAD